MLIFLHKNLLCHRKSQTPTKKKSSLACESLRFWRFVCFVNFLFKRTGCSFWDVLVYCTRKCVRSAKSSSAHQKNAFSLWFCLAECHDFRFSCSECVSFEQKLSFYLKNMLFLTPKSSDNV
jgi:hypothetical protein